MLVSAEGEMHRQVFQNIENVDEEIVNLEKLTLESIAILEEKKREIRREADPNASFSKVGSKLKLEGDRKLSANDLDTIINEIDREISRIQAEHDATIIELQNRKASMKRRLSSIEKLDLLINVLTYKIFETQYEFRQEMDATMRFRESILNKGGEPSNEDAIELAEIDKKLADCKNMHESVMTSLEGQRAELQRETAMKIEHMDTTLHSLKNQHDKMYADLEQQKIDASPSYIEEISRRMEELNRMLEKDIENLKLLQSQGWKSINSEERIADLLQARGLRVTKSGNFLTSSGLRITQSEASCLGLLEGIKMPRLKAEAEEVVKENKTPDSMTSRTSETTSEGTTESEMSSEDVEYLKKALGRPLTLALAEITAKQPRDPIHYLGHWLFKYRYNQEVDLKRKQEIQDLIEERDRLEREKLHAMIEEEARAAVINIVIRAEEDAIRRELERLARESYMYEDEELESEARDVMGVYDGPTAGQRITTT